MLTAALPVARGTRETFWLSLQTFCITRSVITVLILVYLNFNTGKSARTLEAAVSWEASIFYMVLAAVFAWLAIYVRKRFMLQLLAQLTTDVVVVSLLYIAAGGASSGLAILYLFPLAGAAILAPLVLALFFVSLVTLVLLSESGYQVWRSMSDVSTSQAGVYGAAFFTAVYMVNRLAARLINQEDLAMRRGRDLQLQESINRLVVADMGDGVLVVGPNTEVFAGNPAVERMLGLAMSPARGQFKLTDVPDLVPIAEAFRAWKAERADIGSNLRDSVSYVMIKPGSGGGQDADFDDESAGPATLLRRELVAHLKLRFAKVETPGLNEDRTVIFMRDVTEIENQAQQLKLASMGRLTASIAHEVRNPLSAISHAASLLREDVTEPAQARLLRIVGDNVIRLDRMIEDILRLSRKAQVRDAPLQLDLALEEIVSEFRENHAIKPGMIAIEEIGAHHVRFDPLHLREVVVNLLSNALRYASGDDGSIRIHVVVSSQDRLELHVQDDGQPITPEVRSHLFEPFYTTSSKGTGLGLYVARELCLNNAAMLDYEYRSDTRSAANGQGSTGGRFVITLALERE